MGFRLFSLKWPPLLAVAVLVAVSSLEAQPAATNAWKPIIFSSPDNTEVSSNLTPHATQPAVPSSFQSMLRSFQNASPVATFDNLPAGPIPTPVPIPGQARLSSKSSDNNWNWEFMTPAEILGVAPDQILQTQKGDVNGDANSLTPIERFLKEKSLPVKIRDHLSDIPSPTRNFWANQGSQTNDILSDTISTDFRNLLSIVSSPYLNNAPNDNLFASPNGDSDWSKLIGSLLSSAPVSNPVKQQQQQADMDQFKQLLNLGFMPVTAATPSADGTTTFQPQTTPPSSIDSTAPLVNPIGASFVPLISGIGEPMGLAPLPTITQQASVYSAAPPAWAPQPPPWLSPTPQPFTVPQRKF